MTNLDIFEISADGNFYINNRSLIDIVKEIEIACITKDCEEYQYVPEEGEDPYLIAGSYMPTSKRCSHFFIESKSRNMKYKGYEAVIEYDEVDRLFFGRVINTRDIISFDGMTVDELQQSFEAVIDEYLEDCQREGKEPDKAFSGQFNLRISPELHRKISIEAKKRNISLNSFVEQALEKIL